jgi:hypothetical protein
MQMSDEKRQTRLLPFRLRRRVPRADAQDPAPDEELRELLRAWEAPPVSHEARVRLLAEFRAAARRPPLWRRALRAELRVPLPIAACAVVALASLLAFAARSSTRPAQTRPAAESEAATAVNVAPEVKVVEVPVVRERVVTRVVYVEKKARGVDGLELAAAGAGGPEEGARPRGAGAASSYFTRVDMEDFQPADEMKIKIVRRGKADEK